MVEALDLIGIESLEILLRMFGRDPKVEIK